MNRSALTVAALLFLGSLPLSAQAPSPTPPPSPASQSDLQILDLPKGSGRRDAILAYFRERGYIDDDVNIYTYMDQAAPHYWENGQVLITAVRTGEGYRPLGWYQFYISEVVRKINTTVTIPPPLNEIVGDTMEWNAIVYRPVIATEADTPGPFVDHRPYPDGRFYTVYSEDEWVAREPPPSGDAPPNDSTPPNGDAQSSLGFDAHEAMHIQQLNEAARIEAETEGEDDGWLGAKFYELQAVVFDLAYSAHTDTLESSGALEIAIRATTITSRNHTHRRAGQIIRRYLAVNQLPDLSELTREEIAYHATIILRAIDRYGTELVDRAPDLHHWDEMFGESN